MVRPLDEQALAGLPMTGGTLTVCIEGLDDLENQKPFLQQEGLFVRTRAQAKPFCEFTLIIRLPSGVELSGIPARLVQVVPYGGDPGLMLQLLRYPRDLALRIEQGLSEPNLDDSEEEPDWDTPLEDMPDVTLSDVSLDESGEGNISFDECDDEEMDDAALEADEEIAFDEDEEIVFDEDDDADKVSEDEELPAWKARAEPLEWNVVGHGESRVALLERLRGMTPNERSRMAKRANRMVRSILMRDNEPQVVFFLLKNPRITRQEIVEITKLPILNHQTVTTILANKQWSNNEEVRYNLVRNPKTPLSTAVKLVSSLNMKHLREIAKDWGMKTQIKQTALRLVIQRGGSAE